MLEDQLPPALEEVDQSHLALRALEDVGLVDAHHRQSAAIGVERVGRPRTLLLALQQLPAGDQPLVSAM